MTLEQAVEILNRERHRLREGGEWFIHTGRMVMSHSVLGNGVAWYTEFDALAIAERYEHLAGRYVITVDLSKLPRRPSRASRFDHLNEEALNG